MGGCAKLSTALPGCVAATVSTIVPNRDTRDICIGRCPNAPLKKLHRTTTKYDAVIVFAEVLNRARGIYYRTCVTRGSHGFLRNLDTGIPESSAPHLRYARQPWFPTQLRHRATGKFSAVLALREAAMVSSATSTPGTGNHRIRSSLNSPLKLLCSGGRVRFRGRRPWSASSSAGTWCLRPP